MPPSKPTARNVHSVDDNIIICDKTSICARNGALYDSKSCFRLNIFERNELSAGNSVSRFPSRLSLSLQHSERILELRNFVSLMFYRYSNSILAPFISSVLKKFHEKQEYPVCKFECFGSSVFAVKSWTTKISWAMEVKLTWAMHSRVFHKSVFCTWVHTSSVCFYSYDQQHEGIFNHDW